jgi:excisionase family DNA binding protein
MPLVPGSVYITNSPAVARWLDASVSLWLKRYTEDGYPSGPVPPWVFAEKAALQSLGYGRSETVGNGDVSQKGQPAMVSVMETADRLGVTRQAVTKWCRNGKLTATRDGRAWLVDAHSVQEMEQTA